MTEAEVRRKVDELMALVDQGIIPRAKALQMAERMYRLALPDDIRIAYDGRIISPLEELMEENRTDISAKEMNEFWEQEKRQARDDLRLGNHRIQPESSAVAIRERHDIQRQRLAAGMGIPQGRPLSMPQIGEVWRDGIGPMTVVGTDGQNVSVQRNGSGPVYSGCSMGTWRDWIHVSGATKKDPKIQAPAPRAHDFSNPYLPSRSLKGHNLCVECGLIGTSDGCTPNPGWRSRYEFEIANDTDHQAKNRRLNGTPPKPQPYRNDVSGIGSVMGGLHNCAPERGR